MMLNINQKTNPPPKFIKKYNISDEAMLNVRNEIQSEELYRKLGKSCTADINLRPPAGRQMTKLPMPISQQPFNRS